MDVVWHQAVRKDRKLIVMGGASKLRERSDRSLVVREEVSS